MSLLVCLGSTPDTWWSAKNEIGRRLVSKAEELTDNDGALRALKAGAAAQTLNLNEMEPALRDRVWAAVESAARQLSDEKSGDWPTDWTDHLAELAEEMELRHSDPERPGRWPSRQA